MKHSPAMELMTLDGVSIRMANRIVDWHNQKLRISRKKLGKIAFKLGYIQAIQDYNDHLLLGLN